MRKDKKSDKKEDMSQKLYRDVRTKIIVHGGTMLSNINVTAVTNYGLSVHAFLRVMVIKLVPVSYVEDPDFRHLAKMLCACVLSLWLYSSSSSLWRTISISNYDEREELLCSTGELVLA